MVNSAKTVVKAAHDSVNNGANRVAIVTSGKTPDESDFDTMLDMIFGTLGGMLVEFVALLCARWRRTDKLSS